MLNLSNLKKGNFPTTVYLPLVYHHLTGRYFKVWREDKTMVTSIDYSACLRASGFEPHDSRQTEEQIKDLQKIEVRDDFIIKNLIRWKKQSPGIDSAKLIVILSRPYEFKTKMSVDSQCVFHTLIPLFTIEPPHGRF